MADFPAGWRELVHLHLPTISRASVVSSGSPRSASRGNRDAQAPFLLWKGFRPQGAGGITRDPVQRAT